MIIQQRASAPELSDARNAKALAAKLAGKRGPIKVKSPFAPAAVGSPEPQAPPKQAGSEAAPGQAPEAADQNRELVPEGAEAPAASESAQAETEAPPQGEKAKTVKKFHRLLEQKAAANAEVAALKAQVAALQAQAGSPQAQPGQAPAQAPPRRTVEFSKPFPENGTTEDQMVWKAEKAGHDAAQRVFAEQLPGQLGESFGKFAQVISPALNHTLGQMYDQQWKGMGEKLESVGLTESAVRPLVEQELSNNPGLGVEEALGRVLFHPNFSAHWQDEAQAPAPAAARAPARPAGPARGQTSRTVPAMQAGDDPVQHARDLRRNGQKFQAEQYMAKHLAGRMSAQKK